MSTELQQINPNIIQSLVLQGDLSKMNDAQRVEYYNKFCQSLGLNPLTQPFQIIRLQGKEKLYATKDCTEQLRRIYGVSVTDITTQKFEDVFSVTVKVLDSKGRTDVATGAVPIGNLKGEALANAFMKAETKAKRRATLSICGLGMLDETELETIPSSQVEPARQLQVAMATDEQVNTILELCKSEYIYDKEKKMIMQNVRTYNAAKADVVINTLNNYINDRTPKPEIVEEADESPEEEAATDKQKELLWRFMQSSVVKGYEKESMQKDLPMMSKKIASSLIEYWKEEIEKRKKPVTA